MKNTAPEPEKIKVLSKFLGLHYQTAKKLLRNEDYEVLTDSEADERWDDELNNFFEEIVLEEIPDRYWCYFDSEKWFWDARVNSCRADMIARYDGVEHIYDDQYGRYFIYRKN